MLPRPKTVEEWMHRLQGKTLQFLQDQRSPHVLGHNGEAYDAAVYQLIKERMEAGETVEPPRMPQTAVPIQEEEGEVEVIPFGGKGGTMRIVHPKA